MIELIGYCANCGKKILSNEFYHALTVTKEKLNYTKKYPKGIISVYGDAVQISYYHIRCTPFTRIEKEQGGTTK